MVTVKEFFRWGLVFLINDAQTSGSWRFDLVNKRRIQIGLSAVAVPTAISVHQGSTCMLEKIISLSVFSLILYLFFIIISIDFLVAMSMFV